MTNDDTFLQAMTQWQPRAAPEPSFRLYHDQQGNPLFYSMEPAVGEWIEITCEQYHRASAKVMVCQGRLQPRPRPIYPKLRPSDQGTRCHVHDVTLVVSQEPSRYWS